MNRTKIEWTDYSWNPITGCTRNCDYCYAHKMAIRLKGRGGYPLDDPFYPTFHENRLNEPQSVKRNSMIFTCSMGDIFDPFIKDIWREKVYDVIKGSPGHTFQILTKQRVIEPGNGGFNDNIWLGVSIDGSSSYWKKPLESLKSSTAKVKFISFEPLIGENITLNFNGIDWIIIGAQTGNGSKPPDMKVVMKIIKKARKENVPVFIKPNIRKYFDNGFGLEYKDLEEFPIME